MNFSARFSVFLLAASSLYNTVVGLTAFSYVRIEIDPDVTSIQANCSTAFQTSLQSQIQGWVNDGIALHLGQRSDQNIPYNLTYQTLWDGQWGHRTLDETLEQSHNQLRAVVKTNLEERKLCSLSSCYKCCKPACLIYCGCYLCGGSRRNLDSSTNSWSMTANDEVALAVQVLASTWLSEYDSKWCMGNPWKANFNVNFVK